MAKREKIDRVLAGQMEEIERRMFLLKISYEKYFSGVEAVEPMREKDDLKRVMREISRRRIVTTRERHKWQALKARMTSLEQYWKRNLLMIERGTHPKMQFRANRRASSKGTPVNTGVESRLSAQREAKEKATREEAELRKVFDRFVAARQKCGQESDLSYRAVRQVLRGQARNIRSRFRCEDVKFKVSVEKGQAKVKAVPVKD
jgi:hypothetical protein